MIWVYKTAFTDERQDFLDFVQARTQKDAYNEAVKVVRGIDQQGYGIDEFADVEIIGPVEYSAIIGCL